MAAVVGNRKDAELDIALLSTKDGTVVRNLTNGFDQSKGWVFITYPGSRYFQVSWMSWSPKGDRIAYFVRTEKERALILQNVVTGDIEKRFAMKTVDEPESPTISPDGQSVIFSALRARSAISTARYRFGEDREPHQRRLRRLRTDLLARRQVRGLHGPYQRQREAVPSRPRYQEEDAAHLRHARRCAGEVRGRSHAGLRVDGA